MQNYSIFWCFFIFFPIHVYIHATHFQGGTITYKVVNTSGSTITILLTQTYIYDYTKISCNDAMIANQSPKLTFGGSYPENSSTVICVQYCNQSGGYIPQSVVSYCTDYSASLGITVGQRSDRIDLINGSYFLVAYESLSWRQLSRPSGSTSTNTKWSILCLINLQMRADGTFNDPPTAAIISPIYIPVGVQQVISIPTIDSDNDDVRCRFANGTTECGNACPPATLPSGTVLFSNCTLLITGLTAGDWYAVAVQIEDFIDSSSTTRLSTVPLQFLINVQATSSCAVRPSLTSPTSASGKCVAIRVGQPYAIQLIAENFCPSTTTIVDIATISFPIVIKTPIVKNSTSLWSVSLTWTPTADAVGSQVLCAVAVDSGKVQSNQYCMTFTVSEDTTPLCPGETTSTTTTSTSTTSTSSSSSTSTSTSSTSTSSTSSTSTSTSSTSTSTSSSTSTSTSSTSTSTSSTSTSTTSTSTSSTSSTSTSSTSSTSTSTSSTSTSSTSTTSTSTSTTSTSTSTTSTSTSSTSTSTSSTSTTSTSSTSTSTSTTSTSTSTTSTTTTTTASPTPDSSDSTWTLLGIILGILALLLLALALCCSCLFCCPKSCLWCPLKRRQKNRSPSREIPNGLPKRLVDYYIIDKSFNKSPRSPDTISDTIHPSSIASSRTADDIKLDILSSARSEKRRPHYAMPLKRSPRVVPSPSLSLSLSSAASTFPAEYLFGSRQALNITQRSAN